MTRARFFFSGAFFICGSGLLLCTGRADSFSDQFKPRMSKPTTDTTATTSSSGTSASAASGQVLDGKWKLVWADEFDGTSLDSSKWQIEVNGKGGGNSELQYYTNRPSNIHLSNGRLIISANKEEYKGPDGKRGYTSGRITSKGKGDWKYGRFEARIKMPSGKGLWPAFWMMPTASVYGQWPLSGELDIAEVIGHQPDIVHGTLHYGQKWPHNVHSGDKFHCPNGDFSTDFHVFSVEWKEGEIRWLVDGTLYQTQITWNTASAPFPAPFNQKFYFIFNVAVGGTWPGPPNAQTVFPQTMEVDWVRAYEPAN